MSQLTDFTRRKFIAGAGVTALAGAVGAGSATASDAAKPVRSDGKFDFDTIYDRRGTDCVKWDGQIETFGDRVSVGMGIADLDFRAAPCVTAGDPQTPRA